MRFVSLPSPMRPRGVPSRVFHPTTRSIRIFGLSLHTSAVGGSLNRVRTDKPKLFAEGGQIRRALTELNIQWVPSASPSDLGGAEPFFVEVWTNLAGELRSADAMNFRTPPLLIWKTFFSLVGTQILSHSSARIAVPRLRLRRTWDRSSVPCTRVRYLARALSALTTTCTVFSARLPGSASAGRRCGLRPVQTVGFVLDGTGRMWSWKSSGRISKLWIPSYRKPRESPVFPIAPG